MTICERMFDVMDQKNIKQKDLAEKIGIGTANVSNWKIRGSNPPIEYGVKIANTLGVSLTWLITGREDPDLVALSDDERRLLESFRNCNQDGKDRIQEQADFMQQKHPSNLKTLSEKRA